MPSCRCTCKAYGGSCDCRFHGLSAGRLQGETETVAKIVAWLRGMGTGMPSTHEEAIADATYRAAADKIASGDWR